MSLLQGAAGVGKAVADWIVNGRPPVNCLEFEVARFTSLHNNPRFLLKRTEEVVGKHYQQKYPLGTYILFLALGCQFFIVAISLNLKRQGLHLYVRPGGTSSKAVETAIKFFTNILKNCYTLILLAALWLLLGTF